MFHRDQLEELQCTVQALQQKVEFASDREDAGEDGGDFVQLAAHQRHRALRDNSAVIRPLRITYALANAGITVFSKKYLSATTENIYSFKNICVVVIEVLMIVCLLK